MDKDWCNPCNTYTFQYFEQDSYSYVCESCGHHYKAGYSRH